MKSIEAKKFIKLGTALRYLVDVKYKMSDKYTNPEPFGDDHIIDNVSIVKDLIQELEMKGTTNAGSFKNFKKIRDELRKASRSHTNISIEQAEKLSDCSRRLRDSLITEGDNKFVYYLNKSELRSLGSPGWPSELTLELVKKTPFSILKWFLGLLFTAFAFGITIGEYKVVTNIIEWVGSTNNESSQNISESEVDSPEMLNKNETHFANYWHHQP